MQETIRRLLAELGEDTAREGLRETPRRVEQSLKFLTSGYDADIDTVLNHALFTVEYSEMVIVRDIDFYSLCEHHLLPFFGRCHIAYLPNGRVIGLSKIPRLVDVFARRLQVQERLTSQIADIIRDKVDPLGVAVVMEATHLCMAMRGVQKQNSVTVTSAMLGVFREDARTRHEFLELIRHRGHGESARGVADLGILPAGVIAGLIFLATYIVVATGGVPGLRLDRTGAAIVGAALMVIAGVLTLDEAWRAIDYRTLLLLFGMMVLIASLRLARFFDTVARAVVSRVSSPAAVLVAVVFTSGILSALFVNDTICLVFTPVLIEVARLRGHRPLPYLLALATSSNIGSVATITGNPQNMLIGSVSGLSYAHFTRALAPVAGVGLALDAAILYWLFRHDLSSVSVVPAGRPLRAMHRAMMRKSLVIAAAVLAGFLAGYPPAIVAVAAAAALIVTRRVRPEKLYGRVDWDLLMLFTGLFVVVAGVERAGLVDRLFGVLRPIGLGSLYGLAATAALLSNLISNVPAVMLFKSVVPQLPNAPAAWLTLAMSSTLAGNLTLLGSIANLIVLQGAKRHGVTITFGDYVRVGVPVTLATMAFGVFWLSF